jgi:hypothetical protein
MAAVIIIHSLDDALAALAAATALGCPVRLRSAPGAGAYLGPGLFAQIAAAASAAFPDADATFVLDCGHDAGTAMAALRSGIKHIRVSLEDPAQSRLADIARSQGAAIDDDDSPALDLLNTPSPYESAQKWLAAAQNCAPRGQKAELPRGSRSCTESR